jgi:hypothetical protein
LCGEQRFASEAERLARVFFVARHDDGERHAVEHAGGGERLEHVDDDDVSAFHVDHTRTPRGVRIEALELLK